MKRLISLVSVLALTGSVVSADTFNIEIDYMVGTHTHKPTTAVLNAVKQAFACQGHTLNIDLDDSIPHRNVLRRNPDDCNTSLFGYDDGTYSSFGQIRQDFFDHDGQAGWFYGLFVHQYENTSCNTTGSSGLSNGGTFFIVSLGGFSGQVGTAFDNSSTLMHEFGHNMGLSHCGTQACGSDTSVSDYVGPQVPNMPSTMSYTYQLAGVETNMLCLGISLSNSLFKEIDYSHGRMCSQNENNLNEFFGSGMTELDWDCDGTIETGVVQNINNSSSGWCGASGNRTTVADYNEWANLSPGTQLESAAETGDFSHLLKADYRFVDPTDRPAVRRIARQFLSENKRPELRATLLEVLASGDAKAMELARVLLFDPNDRAAVKAFASKTLEERRIMLDDQPCISAERQQVQAQLGGCAQPALTTESCLGGRNVYVGTLFCLPFPPVCFDFGTCSLPHGSIQNAHALQPARSVFYLKPKTYDETGTTLLDKPGLWTCERTDGGGSAVIR